MRRRTAEGAAPASSTTKLPMCQNFPLTIPPEVPPEVHSSPQIVIAHRGASSHLPEHSLEGYRLALELGADYIEPDLVATADHHLVAMHSLDLTVTTNVEEVFGSSKNKTLSKFVQDMVSKETGTDHDAIGYWVYDFTLAELKQLRLKQRLGGSENNGRTKAFDGLFQIPTLTEILELLNDWNENIQPLMYHDNNNMTVNINIKRPHRYTPPPRGLYAELKDFPWLLTDANINLVDLFFDHIRTEELAWEKALLRHMCDTKRLREHEYRLPPLVMQSFEAEVLKNFANRWEEIANHKGADGDSNGNSTNIPDLTFEVTLDSGETTKIPLPTPPTIVLVSQDNCREENFWFGIEDSYRKVITGIGPDKMCFFHAEGSSQESLTFHYEPTVMEKAKELGWVVHSWTERPEGTFFATTPKQRRLTQSERTNLVPFENALEELMFLKCTVGVHGVFSESVDIAVRAMGMACPDNKSGGQHSLGSNGGSSPTTIGFQTSEVPLLPVAAFSFVSGILAALMAWKYCGGGGSGGDEATSEQPQTPQTRRPPRIRGKRPSNLQPHLAIPTEDELPVDLTDNDRELL